MPHLEISVSMESNAAGSNEADTSSSSHLSAASSTQVAQLKAQQNDHPASPIAEPASSVPVVSSENRKRLLVAIQGNAAKTMGAILSAHPALLCDDEVFEAAIWQLTTEESVIGFMSAYAGLNLDQRMTFNAKIKHVLHLNRNNFFNRLQDLPRDFYVQIDKIWRRELGKYKVDDKKIVGQFLGEIGRKNPDQLVRILNKEYLRRLAVFLGFHVNGEILIVAASLGYRQVVNHLLSTYESIDSYVLANAAIHALAISQDLAIMIYNHVFNSVIHYKLEGSRSRDFYVNQFNNDNHLNNKKLYALENYFRGLFPYASSVDIGLFSAVWSVLSGGKDKEETLSAFTYRYMRLNECMQRIDTIDFRDIFEQGLQVVLQCAELFKLSMLTHLFPIATQLGSTYIQQLLDFIASFAPAMLLCPVIGRGDTLAHRAVRTGNLELTRGVLAMNREMLNRLNDRHETLLHLAVQTLSLPMIEMLVEEFGISVLVQDVNHNTPLDCVITLANTLVASVTEKDPSSAEFFIAKQRYEQIMQIFDYLHSMLTRETIDIMSMDSLKSSYNKKLLDIHEDQLRQRIKSAVCAWRNTCFAYLPEGLGNMSELIIDSQSDYSIADLAFNMLALLLLPKTKLKLRLPDNVLQSNLQDLVIEPKVYSWGPSYRFSSSEKDFGTLDDFISCWKDLVLLLKTRDIYIEILQSRDFSQLPFWNRLATSDDAFPYASIQAIEASELGIFDKMPELAKAALSKARTWLQEEWSRLSSIYFEASKQEQQQGRMPALPHTLPSLKALCNRSLVMSAAKTPNGQKWSEFFSNPIIHKASADEDDQILQLPSGTPICSSK